MKNGYIKLYRKIGDNAVIQNPEVLQLLVYFLLKATYKKRYELVGKTLVFLQPGQLIFGRKATAHYLKTTERKVRTCLEVLKKMGIITIKPTNKFSIISIVKWDRYQQADQLDDHQNDQQMTNSQQANDQQTTTNKKEKNVIEGKEIKDTASELKNGVVPLNKIIKAFNTYSGLNPVIEVTNLRTQTIIRLWNGSTKRQNLEWWIDFFKSIKKSPFLQGNNDRNWLANFDWIIKEQNFIKILEGHYINHATEKQGIQISETLKRYRNELMIFESIIKGEMVLDETISYMDAMERYEYNNDGTTGGFMDRMKERIEGIQSRIKEIEASN